MAALRVQAGSVLGASRRPSASPRLAVRCQAAVSVSRRDALLAAGVALVAGSQVQSVHAATATTAHSPFVKTVKDIVFVPVTEELLQKQGTKSWPTWQHGVDKFPYTYDFDEDCYFLEGKVIVTPTGGKPVTIKAGDYVTFPAKMSCTWDILEPVKKHYKEYM